MQIATARINSKNLITLPREVCKALNVKRGDEVLFVFREGEIHLRLRPVSFTQTLRALHKDMWADAIVEHWLTEKRKAWNEMHP